MHYFLASWFLTKINYEKECFYDVILLYAGLFFRISFNVMYHLFIKEISTGTFVICEPSHELGHDEVGTTKPPGVTTGFKSLRSR